MHGVKMEEVAGEVIATTAFGHWEETDDIFLYCGNIDHFLGQ